MDMIYGLGKFINGKTLEVATGGPWLSGVQKKFPDNRNPDNRGTAILRIEILIIEELLLLMEYFINPSIARITVIEVP